MKDKTLLEKTLLGLVSGAASLALVSCTTPGTNTSSSAADMSAQMGKCYGVKCGGSCKGGSCGGKDKKSECGKDKKGGCGKDKKSECGKDKKGGCGKEKHAGCGKECGGDHKSKHAGCGKECGGDAKAGKKKEYKMMTKKDCEKKGGRWEAK